MPRHRRKRPAVQRGPAQIVVACTGSFHHGEPGYAERGHHVVGELRHVPGAPGGVVWSGCAPEPGPFRRPGIAIAAGLVDGSPPFKRHVGDDGQARWRLRCSCGDDRQRSEADLVAMIAAWIRVFPGQPCVIPMDRL